MNANQHTVTTLRPGHHVDARLTALATLEGARRALTHGGRTSYAVDLLTDFIEWQDHDGAEPTQLEADSLFRTLVLDESWPVARAGAVYLAAHALARD